MRALTFVAFKGYSDFTLKRIFKRLEVQGYLSRARGRRSGFVRVDGEDCRKARIIEYGDPLKYIGQYVGQGKHLRYKLSVSGRRLTATEVQSCRSRRC